MIVSILFQKCEIQDNVVSFNLLAEWAAPEKIEPSAHKTRLPLYERKPRASWKPESEKSSEPVNLPECTDPFWECNSTNTNRSTLNDPNVPYWMDPVWMHDSPIKKV